MGKELLNWENGRWIGQTLEVENGVCAIPGKDLDGMPEGLAYTDEVKAATDHLYDQVSDFSNSAEEIANKLALIARGHSSVSLQNFDVFQRRVRKLNESYEKAKEKLVI